MFSSTPVVTAVPCNVEDEHDLEEDSISSDCTREDEHAEFAMMLGGDDLEDDMDIETYNRMFLQQQQIRQERHQAQHLKQAEKHRKRIAEAILSGIHVKTPKRGSNGSSSTGGDSETAIYSILRSPDGSAVLRVPLVDPGSSYEQDEEEEEPICIVDQVPNIAKSQVANGLASQGPFATGINSVGPSSA